VTFDGCTGQDFSVGGIAVAAFELNQALLAKVKATNVMFQSDDAAITVKALSSWQSEVTGTVTVTAVGATSGTLTFSGASTYPTLVASADFGIIVNADVTSTAGALGFDAPTVTIQTGVSITSATLTVTGETLTFTNPTLITTSGNMRIGDSSTKTVTLAGTDGISNAITAGTTSGELVIETGNINPNSIDCDYFDLTTTSGGDLTILGYDVDLKECPLSSAADIDLDTIGNTLALTDTSLTATANCQVGASSSTHTLALTAGLSWSCLTFTLDGAQVAVTGAGLLHITTTQDSTAATTDLSIAGSSGFNLATGTSLKLSVKEFLSLAGTVSLSTFHLTMLHVGPEQPDKQR
jgi:hypothetical protein